MHKLIILSGPSCAGKTPLLKALRRCFPSLTGGLRKLVLYNSRAPRPGEKEGVDYFFMARKKVRALSRRKDFIVMDVRGDLQALDAASLRKALSRANVIFEGNTFIGRVLLFHPLLKDFPKISVFLSPLSKKEIGALLGLKTRPSTENMISGLMRGKLLRRAIKQGRALNAYALKDIERRAKSAPLEMRDAFLYDTVVPNHDGEDSPNWSRSGMPSGYAGRALKAFAAILKGKKPALAEKWRKGLL